MIDDHFRQFQKENNFRTVNDEPTCYSCRAFDYVNENNFICLASGKDDSFMKVSITTVCNKFSPA